MRAAASLEAAQRYVATSRTSGELQLELLKLEGCSRESHVLDVGCGCLSAGVPLMRYLRRGRYVGIEPNRWLLGAALADPDPARRGQCLWEPRHVGSQGFARRRVAVPRRFVVPARHRRADSCELRIAGGGQAGIHPALHRAAPPRNSRLARFLRLVSTPDARGDELRRLRAQVTAFESSRWWRLHPRFALRRLLGRDDGAAPETPPDRREEPLPEDFAEHHAEVWRRVAPYTLTTPGKIEALAQAVEYAVSRPVSGAFVECGVWRGGSMMTVALTLLRLGVTDRELYLFDTFEGMPEPGEEDACVGGSAQFRPRFVGVGDRRVRRGT